MTTFLVLIYVFFVFIINFAFHFLSVFFRQSIGREIHWTLAGVLAIADIVVIAVVLNLIGTRGQF